MCARVAVVSNEANAMLDDFEKDVAHLTPVCPVAAKVGKKRNRVSIAGVDGNILSRKGPKTGVELRYYTSKEYSKLSTEEMAELKDLRSAKKTRCLIFNQGLEETDQGPSCRSVETTES